MKIANVMILAVALLALLGGQTRTQNHESVAGRYQLLSAEYGLGYLDANDKVQTDSEVRLFRIDTVTGETWMLMPILTHIDNTKVPSLWLPAGRGAIPAK